jgi:malonate transporter MadL subunit
VALHVKANVGGVGIAMLLLIAAKAWLARRGRLTPGLRLGVEFWAVMYIPSWWPWRRSRTCWRRWKAGRWW